MFHVKHRCSKGGGLPFGELLFTMLLFGLLRCGKRNYFAVPTASDFAHGGKVTKAPSGDAVGRSCGVRLAS